MSKVAMSCIKVLVKAGKITEALEVAKNHNIDTEGLITPKKVETENKNIMNLVAGDVVQFYGARFKIVSTEVVTHRTGTDDQFPPQRGDRVMVAKAEWIDGNIVNGYFGPNKDWTFQGNFRVSHAVEK